ncbi:AAA family ATPase [Nonomuraea rubra]|uniref:AAA family ATPase n=1 Tax=Nonomuraea rubra TaxID=46180 RepID=UPI00361AB11A
MTRAVYVAAGEAGSNKGTVALGLVALLSRQVGTVGVFRPVVRAGREDALINTIRGRFQLALPYEAYAGVTYDDVHADADRAAGDVVARYRALARRCDAVVVVGTDYTDVGAPTEFGFNARLAADLGTPVVNVVSGRGRTAAQVAAAVELSARSWPTTTPASSPSWSPGRPSRSRSGIRHRCSCCRRPPRCARRRWPTWRTPATAGSSWVSATGSGGRPAP